MLANLYKIIASLFPYTVWKIPNSDRKVYITFDDGPNPETTPFILETLKKFNAKATFFCIGKNVERYPELYNRLINEGHSIGNHTYSHLKGWKTKNIEYFNDIDLAAQYIDSKLFRPPYGRIKLSQIRELRYNYSLIFWNILSQDYLETITSEKCLNNVIPHVKSGDIIVFHDSLKAFPRMSYALPKVLEFLQKNGFLCCPIIPIGQLL
ncbi:MAG TPA: polysaccharide deacetylase family protein [Salinivirgaceae bacterium]|nr:polysaccharide deacetylase family protein [Salinivirgaceae bacterium]HQA75974.1 polysaccharide deacetylase family protein [Salinivirgaceae bacterium]